jgi:hypothetical protein
MRERITLGGYDLTREGAKGGIREKPMLFFLVNVSLPSNPSLTY